MRLQLAILSGSIKKEKIIKNEKRCRVGMRRNILKKRKGEHRSEGNCTKLYPYIFPRQNKDVGMVCLDMD